MKNILVFIGTLLIANATMAQTPAVTTTPVTMTVTQSVAPPVIYSMTKAGSPFRINVNGSNLQPGIRVFINGSEWTNLKYKSSYLIKLKKAGHFRATWNLLLTTLLMR